MPEPEPYTEATVAKGWIFWSASLCPREGRTWMHGAPTRLGFTREQALRRIKRTARVLSARNNLKEKVRIDG